MSGLLKIVLIVIVLYIAIQLSMGKSLIPMGITSRAVMGGLYGGRNEEDSDGDYDTPNKYTGGRISMVPRY